MLTLLILIPICSLFIIGVYNAFSYEYIRKFEQSNVSTTSVNYETFARDGDYRYEIFGLLGHKMENWPLWIKKPLFSCVVCMASFHGTYLFWAIESHQNYFSYDIPTYILFIVSLSGLNKLLSNWI